MSDTFKDIKVKAGHIDSTGNLNVKVDAQGVGVTTVSIPESFVNKFLWNPECYNTTTDITDEEDIAVCKQIEDIVFSGNGPVRIDLIGWEHYPEILKMSDESQGFRLVINTIYTLPQIGDVIMSFSLEGWEGSYQLSITLYELTIKQLG